MGLKEGALESLVESNSGLPTSVADSIFPEMLQALDCLAYNGIVHRDIKLENILYVSWPGGQYQFQLGDFGLSNLAARRFAHPRLTCCSRDRPRSSP